MYGDPHWHGEMLESKDVEVVEDSESELEVDDKRGPEVVAELVSPQEELFYGSRNLQSCLLRPL